MVFYLTTNLNQPQPTWWLDWNFLPRMSLQTYEYIWFILIYIICSYIFSTQHLLLQYLLQHFSNTSKTSQAILEPGLSKGRAGEPLNCYGYTPRKLTWRPKIAIFQRRYIFQIIILCIYLNFRGCIPNWDHTIGTMCSQIENHPRCLWNVWKSKMSSRF